MFMDIFLWLPKGKATVPMEQYRAYLAQELVVAFLVYLYCLTTIKRKYNGPKDRSLRHSKTNNISVRLRPDGLLTSHCYTYAEELLDKDDLGECYFPSTNSQTPQSSLIS